MYKTSTWDLSGITPKNFSATCNYIEKKTKAIESRRKLLTNRISSKQFLSIVNQLEDLRKDIAKISCSASLKFSENSANQEAAAKQTRIDTFLTKINNRLIFFDLWFKDLPKKKAEQLIAASGGNKYFLASMRKRKPYTLKENEEKIINIKDITGNSALNSIYNTLTSQFVYDYRRKKVTQNELLMLVKSKDARKRKDAYISLLSKYSDYKDVLGAIYKNIVNDWREESIGLRGFKTPINVRNINNDLPDEAVAALLKICEKNEYLFQRFFEIKRKKLKLAKMHRFDIYAPVEQKEKKISYDKAVSLVLETFNEFSPDFGKAAETIIKNNHVHSKIQKNKHTGAYCCSVTAKLPPFVLLSYKKMPRDVSTLAHELGHGVHHMLARDNSEFTFHSCLPLAETASIFSEMLLSEKMIRDEPQAAKALLFTKLDEIYASIIRQAGFVRFEMKAHEMIEEGKTIQDISNAYLADLRKQLGPKVDVDSHFQYEWSCIPHIFHTPFYCYAYAFGNLLVLALWEMYQQQGKAFVPKMLKFLATGGSASPVEITREIGVDITSEKFWQQGFTAIEKMIAKVK